MRNKFIQNSLVSILLLFSLPLAAQVNSHNLNIVNFHSISVNSQYTVYVKQSNKEEVRVEALKEIYEISEFIVKNGVLHINIEKQDSKANKSIWQQIDDIKIMPTLKVYVSVKDVKSLSVNGNGKLITENSIASSILQLSVAGTGTLEADVKSDSLNISLSGPGNMKLKGYADGMKLVMSGSGNLEAFNCEIQNATSKQYGLGSAEINVSEKLFTEIYGSGSLKVKGATKAIEKHIYGAGELSRVQ